MRDSRGQTAERLASMSTESPPVRSDRAILAHDLRGAIGVARGYARFLLSGVAGPLNEAQRQALEAIDRQTVRLERFLEGFEFSHPPAGTVPTLPGGDRKSTRLNSSHANISYAVFCLNKKNLPAPPMSDLPASSPSRRASRGE